ncbi:MAG: tyrosine-type recombinase/integrase [Planctomycetes bacterium]|nr:tyrosine-type recombinase/integrase [Planctomycetota bacterium]
MRRLESTYRRDLVKAGIPYKTEEGVLDFHALRDGFATLLAREGVPLALAQKLMRHCSADLTSKVYTRLNLGDARGAVARLGRAWEPPSTWRTATVGETVGETCPPSVTKSTCAYGEEGPRATKEDKARTLEASVYTASSA